MKKKNTLRTTRKDIVSLILTIVLLPLWLPVRIFGRIKAKVWSVWYSYWYIRGYGSFNSYIFRMLHGSDSATIIVFVVNLLRTRITRRGDMVRMCDVRELIRKIDLEVRNKALQELGSGKTSRNVYYNVVDLLTRLRKDTINVHGSTERMDVKILEEIYRNAFYYRLYSSKYKDRVYNSAVSYVEDVFRSQVIQQLEELTWKHQKKMRKN